MIIWLHFKEGFKIFLFDHFIWSTKPKQKSSKQLWNRNNVINVQAIIGEMSYICILRGSV
jgi:hypothetical protein